MADVRQLLGHSLNFVGSATIVQVAHPAVTNGLTLDYGSAGTYGGVDRFGRVVDQHWRDTQATPVTKDRFGYGYDANGNRIWRENAVSKNLGTPDDLGSHDGRGVIRLHRFRGRLT